MYSKTNSGKLSKGSVGVETFQGRLRLRLPRQLFGGKQKYLTLGLPDTDTNRPVSCTRESAPAGLSVGF
jgi:hypothetical protein